MMKNEAGIAFPLITYRKISKIAAENNPAPLQTTPPLKKKKSVAKTISWYLPNIIHVVIVYESNPLVYEI